MDEDITPDSKEIPSNLSAQQPSPPQDVPPTWFVKYFGWLNTTMKLIEELQEEDN